MTSQLAATAASRVLPGGGAAANALQYTMLVRGGVPGPTAASGLTAASLMLTGTVFALPALALPAVLGGARIDSVADLPIEIPVRPLQRFVSPA